MHVLLGKTKIAKSSYKSVRENHTKSLIKTLTIQSGQCRKTFVGFFDKGLRAVQKRTGEIRHFCPALFLLLGGNRGNYQCDSNFNL